MNARHALDGLPMWQTMSPDEDFLHAGLFHKGSPPQETLIRIDFHDPTTGDYVYGHTEIDKGGENSRGIINAFLTHSSYDSSSQEKGGNNEHQIMEDDSTLYVHMYCRSLVSHDRVRPESGQPWSHVSRILRAVL